MDSSYLLHSRRRKIFRIIGIIMSFTTSIVWLFTIAVLFLRWGLDDFVRYDSDDGEVAYISNVGAKHKKGFILGTVTTGVPYFLTVLFTKLYYDYYADKRFRRILSLLSVICALIAGISLILISILDSINHKGAHYTFVALFIIFALLSAIFIIIYRFKRDQFNWVLNITAFLIGLLIPLIIGFVVIGRIGGKSSRMNLQSVAACFEWSLAILLIVYFALFAFDLIFYKQ